MQARGFETKQRLFESSRALFVCKHMLENRRRDATVILQSHPRVSACAVHEHPLEDSVDPYL